LTNAALLAGCDRVQYFARCRYNVEITQLRDDNVTAIILLLLLLLLLFDRIRASGSKLFIVLKTIRGSTKLDTTRYYNITWILKFRKISRQNENAPRENACHYLIDVQNTTFEY